MMLTTASYRKSLFISMILFISFTLQSQNLYYSQPDRIGYINNLTFIVGKQDDNIVAWLYKRSAKLLEVNIYDSRMELLKQATLQPDKFDSLYSINFFKKGSSYEVLVQYRFQANLIIQIFSFDENTNLITPQKILSTSKVYGGTVIKYSGNGAYTGLLQSYNTLNDSTLIQYDVYDKQANLFKNVNFILPQKHDYVSVNSSFMDNAGNLFFNAFTNVKDTTFHQYFTIYEVNVQQDSLLINDIVKSGRYSNVTFQQNHANDQLNLSGTFTYDTVNTTSPNNQVSKYVFQIKLNGNLSQSGDMMLFPVTSVLDSIYSSSHFLRSAKLILYKDSGYVLYLSGLDVLKKKTFDPYYTPKLKDNLLDCGVPAVMPKGLLQSYNSPLASVNQIIHNPMRIYLPINYFEEVNYNCISSGGKNFFTAIDVSRKGIASIHHYKDNTPGFSLPQFDFVANTGMNIHYIYTRLLLKNKQLLFDVFYSATGEVKLNPIVTVEGYSLLINKGVQVDSHSIVFPCLNKSRLAFARMEIE